MKTWARVALTLVVVAVAVARFDLRAALQAAASASVSGVLLAVVCYLGAQMVAAVRWRRVARAAGFTIAPGAAIRVYLTGAFFGLFVPTPVGGDAARALQLGRLPPGLSQAALVSGFDRLLGLVTLAVLTALVVPAVRGRVPASVVASVVIAAGVSVVVWLALPWAARHLPLPDSLRRLAAADVSRWFDRRAQAVLWTLSVIAHGLQIASQLYLVRALGLDLDLALVALCHGVVVVFGSLPLTVAGAGLREGAYVWVLSEAGVEVHQCVALGLLWFAVGLSNALVGGIVFLTTSAPREAAS